MLLLVGQLIVLKVWQLDTGLLVNSKDTVRIVSLEHIGRTGVTCRRRCCGQRITGLQFQVWKSRLQTLEETLLIYVPRSSHVPCGSPAGWAALTHGVTTFVTEGAVQHVTVIETVGAVCKECHRTTVRIRKWVIIGVLFQAFLEELIYIVRYFTLWILHTPTVEPRACTLNTGCLHTTEEVRKVDSVESVGIVGRSTEVVVEHTVLCTSVHTAFRQYGHRQWVELIGVSIKISVFITNQTITHRTISLCLVRTVHNLIFLRGCGELYGTQSRKFQILNRLPFQFTLELGINEVHINVVRL